VRALDSNACSGGNATFVSIHGWLFKQLRESGWSYPEADDFLALLRAIRNMLHNNFHYHPRDGMSRTVHFEGDDYSFVPGEHPEFLSFDLYLRLLRELVDLNASIMTADVVEALAPID
jgi:hypothetical protein